MITVKFRGEKELWRSTIKAERQLVEGLEISSREIAQWVKNYIRANWSENSPSNEGNPPAIHTGNLDSSIKVSNSGRDLLGRFASEKVAVWQVTINTAEGTKPMNRGNYAQVLEFGRRYDMQPRPFMNPALDSAAEEFPDMIIRQVRIRP